MSKQVVAITGINGFIGSALKNFYLQAGHTVVPVPRFMLLAPLKLRNLFEETKPDVIIHCAAYGNHNHHQFGHQVVEANYTSTFNLLREAVIINCKFVLMSSSSVQLPYTTLYSATKYGAELLVQAYINKFNLRGYIVRPGSVTGPGEQYHHLIPTLIRSCLHGKPMKFVGKPTHDYVDIDDLVNAVDLIIKLGKPGHAYQVGKGVCFNNKEVKALVEEITGREANVEKEVDQMREYDQIDWRLDTTAIDSLSWRAKYSLRQSIERAIAAQHPTPNA